MEQLDLGLLRKLCEIHHYSGEEYTMITFVLNEIYKIEGITVELDEQSNLFITKNTTDPDTYPVVIAHLDEVLKYKGKKQVKIKKDTILGFFEKNGIKQRCGLGLDDAFGIYCALHLLSILPDLKVVLTTKEEMGCIGAETAAFNYQFFENARFMLQADRRGSSDLITYTNGWEVTSPQFLEDITPLMHKYNYKEARGTMTDIGTLKDIVNVSACNISCGYYSAHTHNEYGKLSELANCLNFMYEIILTCTKVYPHQSEIIPININYTKQKSCSATFPEWLCYECTDFDCQHCDLIYQ